MTFGGFHGNWPRKPNLKAKPANVVPAPRVKPSGPGTSPVVRVKKNSPQGPSPNVIRVRKSVPQGPAKPTVRTGAVPRSRISEEIVRPAPPPRPEPKLVKNSIAVVGRFKKWPWGQHPDEAYFADAMQACGVQVVKVDQDGDGEEAARAEWILFTSQPASYTKMSRWNGERKTILWTLDWLPDYSDRGHIIEAGREATIFVSSDDFEWTLKYGIKNHFYLAGACESFYPPFDPKPHRSCAFLGSLYNDRRRRIASIVKSLGGEVLDKQGQWVYGPELARFVQGTKVIVGDNVRNDVRGYWSSRNYVVTGAGGFLITPHVPGIEEHFSAGKHVILYSAIDRLGEAIESCLEHDKKREEIRKAGFHHVRVNHNWAVRARTLLETIGILAKKT